jgi:group I intron endonuclease
MGAIYGYHNIVNDKWYIGQTVDEHRRKNAHNCKTSKQYIDCVLRKHSDEFEYYIIENDIDNSLLDEREDYWIKQKNALWPNGYNLTTGGNDKKSISDISRQRMSESAHNRKYSVSIEFSKEHKERLSVSHMGKSLSKEHKENISKALKESAYWKGKSIPDEIKMKTAKPIVAISKDGNETLTFIGANDAAKQLGIAQSNIVACLKGRKKSIGGYYWAYAS